MIFSAMVGKKYMIFLDVWEVYFSPCKRLFLMVNLVACCDTKQYFLLSFKNLNSGISTRNRQTVRKLMMIPEFLKFIMIDISSFEIFPIKSYKIIEGELLEKSSCLELFEHILMRGSESLIKIESNICML